jgi:hypothetical protein
MYFIRTLEPSIKSIEIKIQEILANRRDFSLKNTFSSKPSRPLHISLSLFNNVITQKARFLRRVILSLTSRIKSPEINTNLSIEILNM